MSNLEPAGIADLVRVALAQGKRPFLTVASNSMMPLIYRGDQIQVVPVTVRDLQPGDIIVVSGPYKLQTHRFWGVFSYDSQLSLLTRGDRLRHFDPPVPEAELIGRVVARRRNDRLFGLTSGPGRWLNLCLAQLARLEIRYFACPIPADARESATGFPPITGRFASAERPSVGARLVRRSIFDLARLLAVLATIWPA